MKFKSIILALALATATLAQEAPTSNPSEVWVKGRKVDHSWRGGRIWVPASELKPLLNLGDSAPTLDLINALEQKGGYVWSFANGKFEAKRDASGYSQSAPSSANLRANQAHAAQASRQRAAEAAALPGTLFYRVREFTADTGYVRAYVAVVNDGPNDSDPSEMVCFFTDGFGKPYAKQTIQIPAFAPGQGDVFEAFSMVREADTSIKMTSDNVLCIFLSKTNPHLNPSGETELRRIARARKR